MCIRDSARKLKVVAYDKLLQMDYAFDHKKVLEDYLKQKTGKS